MDSGIYIIRVIMFLMDKFELVCLVGMLICLSGAVYIFCLATQATQSKIDFCMKNGYDIGYIDIGESPIQACAKDLGETYCTREFIDLSPPFSFQRLLRFQDGNGSCEYLEWLT